MIRDLDTLAKICPDVARLLTQRRSRSRTIPVKMSSGEKIKKAEHDIEAHLFHTINLEMDRLFKSHPYNFTPSTKPSTHAPLITGTIKPVGLIL
jgi:hypothetical protein